MTWATLRPIAPRLDVASKRNDTNSTFFILDSPAHANRHATSERLTNAVNLPDNIQDGAVVEQARRLYRFGRPAFWRFAV
jgi:hypothetical protein